MGIFSRIVAFILSVFAFFGINFNNPFTEPVTPEPYTPQVTVNEDSSITVALTENASTGYTWEFDIRNGSAELKENRYSSANVAEGIVSAAGTRYFTFDITADGTTEIEFQYLRPWEDSIPPQKCLLTVTKENGEITYKALETIKYSAE